MFVQFVRKRKGGILFRVELMNYIHTYRMVHLVADNLLLTSNMNWELGLSIRSDGNFEFDEKNSVTQPDGPPCTYV